MNARTERKTMVFIHGLFQNPDSWAQWQAFFESRGYTCFAPAYPYHEGSPAVLRKHPDPRLGHLTLQTVVDAMARFVDQLAERPILVGHSMGGLVVQNLIASNRGASGVCIDSAPPKGIISFQWSFLKANLSTINPLKGDSVCLPSIGWFHYAFCNTMTMEEAQREYDRFVVPESRNIPRSSTGPEGRIDFSRPHAPLLFIAGEKDHIVPASLNRKNFQAYRDRESIREFREFSGRSHYICGQRGWEEVASFVDQWLGTIPRV